MDGGISGAVRSQDLVGSGATILGGTLVADDFDGSGDVSSKKLSLRSGPDLHPKELETVHDPVVITIGSFPGAPMEAHHGGSAVVRAALVPSD